MQANQEDVRSFAGLAKSSVRTQASISAAGGHIDFTIEDARQVELLRAYGAAMTGKLREHQFHMLLALFSADEELVNNVKAGGGIAFTTELQPAGFRLNLVASSSESRAAVHEFLQVPKTEANRAARHPGNNLGWDGPPVAPDVQK